ncbi:hypothetical protein [Immundisolibacter cernigliae]|uniref:hypothetical protein n=1 Tax=Immundisolibacter cernigliae TaxID=1810504 RepID=UPI0013145528|nr:hypothetical protein [Immundisolibacter cernigliae]
MQFFVLRPRALVLAMTLPLLGGCGALSGLLGHDPQEQQYKQAETLPPLEVPPDLTGAASSSALVVPGIDDGSAAGGAAMRMRRRPALRRRRNSWPAMARRPIRPDRVSRRAARARRGWWCRRISPAPGAASARRSKPPK